MGLVTSTAFRTNFGLQPRCFLSLGWLIKKDGIYDEMLLFQVLLSLVDSLGTFNNLQQDSDFSLIVSIVMCLTKMVVNIPK